MSLTNNSPVQRRKRINHNNHQSNGSQSLSQDSVSSATASSNVSSQSIGSRTSFPEPSASTSRAPSSTANTELSLNVNGQSNITNSHSIAPRKRYNHNKSLHRGDITGSSTNSTNSHTHNTPITSTKNGVINLTDSPITIATVAPTTINIDGITDSIDMSFNLNHNENDTDLTDHALSIMDDDAEMKELADRYGVPNNQAEFNIMLIANEIRKANIQHENRRLKSTLNQFQRSMSEKQSEIKTLDERVEIYKKESEKFERLQIEYDKVKELNKNLLSYLTAEKQKVSDLREKIKSHNRSATTSAHSSSMELDVIPLPIGENEQSPASILAHSGDANESTTAQAKGELSIEPLQIDDMNADGSNKSDEESESRNCSSWLRNQRLIQLTGDTTYMTAHQKVIKDADQKKSHQSYQRKDTFKSIQNENAALKSQVVALTKEIEEVRTQIGSASDGMTVDHLKQTLSKLREELDEQKRVTTKFKAAMKSEDDDEPETIKEKLAHSLAELERLKIRYEKSKQRVDNLSAETEEMKKAKDAALKERDQTKETSSKLIKAAKEHIVKVANEKETYRKEMCRLTADNKKLLRRESEEEEMKEEMNKLQKKVKHLEKEVTKYKKKWKDLKLQIDDGTIKRRTLRRSKRIQKIADSNDSSENEAVNDMEDVLKDMEVDNGDGNDDGDGDEGAKSGSDEDDDGKKGSKRKSKRKSKGKKDKKVKTYKKKGKHKFSKKGKWKGKYKKKGRVSKDMDAEDAEDNPNAKEQDTNSVANSNNKPKPSNSKLHPAPVPTIPDPNASAENLFSADNLLDSDEDWLDADGDLEALNELNPNNLPVAPPAKVQIKTEISEPANEMATNRESSSSLPIAANLESAMVRPEETPKSDSYRSMTYIGKNAPPEQRPITGANGERNKTAIKCEFSINVPKNTNTLISAPGLSVNPSIITKTEDSVGHQNNSCNNVMKHDGTNTAALHPGDMSQAVQDLQLDAEHLLADIGLDQHTNDNMPHDDNPGDAGPVEALKLDADDLMMGNDHGLHNNNESMELTIGTVINVDGQSNERFAGQPQQIVPDPHSSLNANAVDQVAADDDSEDDFLDPHAAISQPMQVTPAIEGLAAQNIEGYEEISRDLQNPEMNVPIESNEQNDNQEESEDSDGDDDMFDGLDVELQMQSPIQSKLSKVNPFRMGKSVPKTEVVANDSDDILQLKTENLEPAPLAIASPTAPAPSEPDVTNTNHHDPTAGSDSNNPQPLSLFGGVSDSDVDQSDRSDAPCSVPADALSSAPNIAQEPVVPLSIKRDESQINVCTPNDDRRDTSEDAPIIPKNEPDSIWQQSTTNNTLSAEPLSFGFGVGVMNEDAPNQVANDVAPETNNTIHTMNVADDLDQAAQDLGLNTDNLMADTNNEQQTNDGATTNSQGTGSLGVSALEVEVDDGPLNSSELASALDAHLEDTTNNRKRIRESDDVDVMQPQSKRRKLGTDIHCASATTNTEANNTNVMEDANALEMDMDFDNFMGEDHGDTLHCTTLPQQPASDDVLSGDSTMMQQTSVSSVPSAVANGDQQPLQTTHAPSSAVKMEPEPNFNGEAQQEINANPVDNRFADWKHEFGFLLSQKIQNQPISLCIQSLSDRLRTESHSPKDIAQGILGVILCQQFDQFFASNFFTASNLYLPFLAELCHIISQLDPSSTSGNKSVIGKLKIRCRKIKDSQDKDSRFKINYGGRMYFVCGLLSTLCKRTNDEGSFWRFVVTLFDRFEVHQVAGLSAVIFACYSDQIEKFQDYFVQQCFRRILIQHCINMKNAKYRDPVLLEEVKQNYKRLSAVFVSIQIKILKWDPAERLKKQLEKVIKSGGIDPDINGATNNGFIMFCNADTRYAHNKALPQVLYPVMIQVLQSQTAKPEVQVFLLNLYCDCAHRVEQKLSLWTVDESERRLATSGILFVMEQIVGYALVTRCEVGKVQPLVVICCMVNIMRLENSEKIQNIMVKSLDSEDVLIQCLENMLPAWKHKIESLETPKMIKAEKTQFGSIMNMIEGVFVAKGYSLETFYSLKAKHNPHS